MAPYAYGGAVELGNGIWRKRVLPVGDTTYKGRVIHFTKDYLQTLLAAFRDGAYDAVPLQLAGADGGHTLDPERTRGQVLDMDLQPDGLYVTAELTPEGDAVLRGNPGLGLGARIVEDYQRSDGKHYTAALQHVLATHTPVIPQLGPWEPVEASNSGVDVINLSNSGWATGPDDDEAVYAQVLAELAEEGQDVDDDGASPDDDEPAVDDHFHEHAHVHDSGLSHSHGHPHDHDGPSHDQPGQTSNFANGEDHEHAHAHTHMGAGKHGHLHAHGHDAAAHLAVHASIGPDGYGAGGDACELASMNAAVELAHATERARTAQHAARPSRMPADARLADALARIGTGTYTPSRAAQVLGFAGDAASSAGRSWPSSGGRRSSRRSSCATTAARPIRSATAWRRTTTCHVRAWPPPTWLRRWRRLASSTTSPPPRGRMGRAVAG